MRDNKRTGILAINNSFSIITSSASSSIIYIKSLNWSKYRIQVLKNKQHGLIMNLNNKLCLKKILHTSHSNNIEVVLTALADINVGGIKDLFGGPLLK